MGFVIRWRCDVPALSHGLESSCGMLCDNVNDELWRSMADTCIHVCWYKLVINKMLACGFGSLHKKHQKTLCVPGDHLFTDSDNIILSTVHCPSVQPLSWLNWADAMRSNRHAVLGTQRQTTNALFVNHDGFVFAHYYFFPPRWLARSAGLPLCIFANPFN